MIILQYFFILLDIDRIIEADKIDNEALKYAIIGDELSYSVDKGLNELSDSINIKSLEIQQNISAGLPPMSVAINKNNKLTSNKAINSKANPNPKASINKASIKYPIATNKVVDHKKPAVTVKSSLTRRVSDPIRLQKNNTYVTKPNASKSTKNISKYDKDSSLLDMLETQENNSFIRVSKPTEKTQQLRYYNDVSNSDTLRMSTVIHQNMNSVVSEVARLSIMLEDLNREIEQKVSSDIAPDNRRSSNTDDIGRTEGVYNSLQFEKIRQDKSTFIDYPVETFDDTVNYCDDDDDEVQRQSFDNADDIINNDNNKQYNQTREPQSVSPSKDIIMKNIVDKLHKSISSTASKNIPEEKSDSRRKILTEVRPLAKDDNVHDDEKNIRPFPFRSTKHNIENDEIVTEDLNVFPFPLYNDKRNDDDNAQYQRLETLQDPQTRAELGYLQDRKLIMHEYGNDFVVEKILDSAVYDNVPTDSSYDYFSKNYIKSTLDSIDNEGKREVEKIRESDSDVKITSHILPSGQKPTVTWSSTYGLLPSLRNIGELAGMISSDYDSRPYANDYVVTDEESFSDDEEHCIVNIAASELAKKKAEEKVESRVASEKSGYPHKPFSTYIEEVDIKNESIAETSIDSEEEVESPASNNVSQVFIEALNISIPEMLLNDIGGAINDTVNGEAEPESIAQSISGPTDSSKRNVPQRLSPTELRQVMLNELRKQDEILNYELELSELEQAHTIQSASNIVERFISSKELEAMESKKQQELLLHQQAYEMSLTTALLNAQMNMHSESIARNEIIAELQSQMRDQELNQDYANLISCTSQMVDLFQQAPVIESENTAKDNQKEIRKSKEEHFPSRENIQMVQKQTIASPIRSSQQNISISSSIIDEVPDLKFTPIKNFSSRNNDISPNSDYYSDEFEDIDDDEVSEEIIGYVSPRETRSYARPESIKQKESQRPSRTPVTSKNDSFKFETKEFSKTFKEFETEINNRKITQEKKLMLQSQLLKSKKDKHLNHIQQMKRNAEENPSKDSRSLINDLINEENQVKEKYLESSTILEREKWSINAIYYRDLRKLRQMQRDYEFCGGTIDFDGNRDLVDVSLLSRRSISSSKSLYQDDNEEIEEIEDEQEFDRKYDASIEHASMISSRLSLSPKSIKQSIDDPYDEDFEDYRDKDVTVQSLESRKTPISSPKKLITPASKKSTIVTEYQVNDNYLKEIESIEESIAEHQNRIKTIKQNIIGIDSDDKQLDILLKKKAEKERLVAEEARLFKSLNDKLNQISSSKEIASKAVADNTRLAANISTWVQSIREPFTKTIEMLQEEDSLDDSSWCSDIAEVQPTKLPMRLDTYIEKRVKHQFSALLIQKVTRGWLVRKKEYVTKDALALNGDMGQLRGDLVHEHAAVVAVEDMMLEDSFNSEENDGMNFEGQFYNEQKQLQKQMDKVEEMSNMLSRKEKLDIKIHEAQLSQAPSTDATSSSEKASSVAIRSPTKAAESPKVEANVDLSDESTSPSSPKVQATINLSNATSQSASPVKSPVKAARSPKDDTPSSPKLQATINSSNVTPHSTSPVSSNVTSQSTSPAKSPVKFAPSPEGDLDDTSVEEIYTATSPVKSPEKKSPLKAPNEEYDEYSQESTDDSFQKSPVLKSGSMESVEKGQAPVVEDNNISEVSENYEEPSIQVDSSIEEVEYKPSGGDLLEASEVIEDDFEIEEEEEEDDDDDENFVLDDPKNISKEFSDEIDDDEDIINDLSSPGKAVILDETEDNIDEVQLDDYSDDPSPEVYEDNVKPVETKSVSLSSLSDMPPLMSNKIKPTSNDTDFDELYDFDDEGSSPDVHDTKDTTTTNNNNNNKVETVEVPTIDWIGNVDAFFSQILDEVDLLAIVANLDNPSFEEKFIPLQLFETIHSNFKHEYNMVDHCKAVFDRVNDILTELHQLRHHVSAGTSETYTSVLIAKYMTLNGKNVREYIKDKLIVEQKKIQGIMPEVKVNLDMIETTAQMNLNKAADELTDIILARMLSDVSQQLNFY